MRVRDHHSSPCFHVASSFTRSRASLAKLLCVKLELALPFYGGVLFTQVENIKRGHFILDKTECNSNMDLDQDDFWKPRFTACTTRRIAWSFVA